ncbi:N-acetylglucosamine-6-phosphate deacetylase [Caldicellulosiruptoraceae bacterium PP1]
MKAIINGRIILRDKIVNDKVLLFEDNIIDIADRIDFNGNIDIIDANGKYIAPGFINLHIHGCNGYDVMDNNSIEKISKTLLKTGVTSFLATTMSVEFSLIEKTLKQIKDYIKNSNKYSQVLGIHLEGPFINKKYKGAHDERYILKPSFDLIESYNDLIKLVTIAPEVEGAFEFIKRANDENIVISIGHTNATYEQAKLAIEFGARHVTHTFNAMIPLNHRNPGVLGAVLLDSKVTCEIIPDNVHLHPSIINVLLKLKGIDNIIIVTDSMKACLLGDGEYDLGGFKVFVKNNKATLSDGTIAGSVIPMNLAVKNFYNITQLPLYDCFKAASLNPAKLLKIDNKYGSIEKGKLANLIVFDDQFNINATIVEGNILYKNN